MNYELFPDGIVFEGDCFEWMSHMVNESVDLVCTDPAYESLEKWRAIGTKTRLTHSKASSNDWFPIFPNYLYKEFFGMLYTKMKKGTHLYIFCDDETRDMMCSGFSPLCKTFLAESYPISRSGLKYWKTLIWHKGNHVGMGYHYRAQHEFIIFAEKVERKGKHRQLNNRGIGDVLTYPRLTGDVYPASKPVELVELLITQSTNPGDTVFDPFVGGGTTAEACLRTGRKFIVGDINPEAIRVTKERINKYYE